MNLELFPQTWSALTILIKGQFLA